MLICFVILSCNSVLILKSVIDSSLTEEREYLGLYTQRCSDDLLLRRIKIFFTKDVSLNKQDCNANTMYVGCRDE